jgi:hypothetical protein
MLLQSSSRRHRAKYPARHRVFSSYTTQLAEEADGRGLYTGPRVEVRKRKNDKGPDFPATGTLQIGGTAQPKPSILQPKSSVAVIVVDAQGRP